MGHNVKAVVPQFRQKKDKSTDQKRLDELYKAGDVLLAPSKSIPGQYSSSYDDRLILSVAEKFDGVVISNDNFRDLLQTDNDCKYKGVCSTQTSIKSKFHSSLEKDHQNPGHRIHVGHGRVLSAGRSVRSARPKAEGSARE